MQVVFVFLSLISTVFAGDEATTCVIGANQTVIFGQDRETAQWYVLSEDAQKVLSPVSDCSFEEGAHIRMYVVEVPTPPPTTKYIRMTITPPCENTEAWVAVSTEKTRQYLIKAGLPITDIREERTACGTPRIQVEVVEQK